MKIIVIGETHDKDLARKEREFFDRLSFLCKTERIVIKESKGEVDRREKLIGEEGDRVLKSIKPEEFVVVLEEAGKEFTTLGFAKKYSDWVDAGTHVVFVVGGVFGISKDLHNRANLVLSLSKLTFTHELARMLLVEQLYRCESIRQGRRYHY